MNTHFGDKTSYVLALGLRAHVQQPRGTFAGWINIHHHRRIRLALAGRCFIHANR